MQIAKWNETTQQPYDIRDRYSVLASNGVPLKDWPSYTARGYYEYQPVQIAEGERLDDTTYSKPEDIIIQAGTVIDAQTVAAQAQAQAAQDAANAEAARVSEYAAQMSALAPVLDGHPAPADVIPGGMFYRIPDPEDETILTLWYVRDSDHIAQQLSSHDAAGMPINRSVDLKTRVSTTFKLAEIVNGLPNQAKSRAMVSLTVGQAKIKDRKK